MKIPTSGISLFRLSAVLFLLCFFSHKSVWAELNLSLGSDVHVQADTIEYQKDQGLVLAKGQVHIQQGLVHLYADLIRYDLTAQNIFAEGHVVWQDENQEIEAKNLTYNLRTKEGKAMDIKTSSPPWISTGSEIDIQDHKITIKNAVTTTCDYVEGYRHYSLSADRITVYSGDYLVAENVVMFIGKVPVFYFPFFARTIHDLKTPFSIATGATDYLGTYILVTTNYFFTPTNYGALYSDYFFKKGLGLGLRHEIALNSESVLSLYGYGIPEKDTQRFRWEGRARGLWAFSSSLYGRLEADIPGDGFFSQDYSAARRDPSLVSTVREYDISATLTRQQWNLGLLFRRQETPDIAVTSGTSFVQSLQTLPQLTFTLLPQALIFKNWLKYDVRLTADHSYTKTNDFYVNHLNGVFGISQSLMFLQNHSLFSSASWSETFQDVADVSVANTAANNAGETEQIDVNNTWTGRWNEIFSSTFSHVYSKKLNHLFPTDPPDGVRTNLLSGSLEFTAGSFFRAKTSTSFDLRSEAGGDSASFNYLRQEFYLTPSSQVDYLGIMDYSIKANAIKDFNTVLNLKSPHDMWRFRISGNYVDPNVSNTGFVTVGLPSTFEIAGEISLALFTNYRLSMLESFDLTNSKFETRSISIYRDLHDWEAELNFSEDPVQGQRVYFKLNLKAFPGKPLTVSDDQLQRLNGLRNQGLTGAASQFQ